MRITYGICGIYGKIVTPLASQSPQVLIVALRDHS